MSFRLAVINPNSDPAVTGHLRATVARVRPDGSAVDAGYAWPGRALLAQGDNPPARHRSMTSAPAGRPAAGPSEPGTGP